MSNKAWIMVFAAAFTLIQLSALVIPKHERLALARLLGRLAERRGLA